VVTKGETLGGIAAHYGVTVATLKTTNHIVDEKKLAVGQVLNVPPR
jgi:LysM repeat protein